MKKNTGYSLMELMITVALIGIVSALAISPLLQDVPQHKVNNDIILVNQAIRTAKSTAIRTSETTTIDFSSADSAYGSKGGRILVRDNSGAIIKDFILNNGVLYNSTASTIASNKVIFNFKGQPVDSTGSTAGFDSSNNTVAVSAYNGTSAVATRILTVNPLTGSVEIN